MRTPKDICELFTLANGLRVAYLRCPGARVDYCGTVVRVGSRNDDADTFGMAHFVEHTIFKGTEKRSSWHIINRMERVGGELNAYTTKEETVVYTAAPAGNMSRAMELIADLVTSSRFPESELAKEREVVADEIDSYLDTPSEAVYDDFEDLLFEGSPLGHNILGNADAIARIDSERCRRYLRRWYTARNMVLFYSGATSAERVLAAAERYFGAIAAGEPAEAAAARPTGRLFSEVRTIGAHQAHTVMGCLIPGMHSADRYAFALLTNILGGPGMNSILNIALREKRGYVYSVDASSTLFSDCGLFTVYFGCDDGDTERCAHLVAGHIADLADYPLSAARLAAAKKQYVGQLAVSSDNRESMAISAARTALFFNKPASPRRTIDSILELTPEDVATAAGALLPLSRLTLR